MNSKTLNPIEISKLKRTKFWKGIYRFFDILLPEKRWPIIGKLSNSIRINIFRRISPGVSKKAWIGKNVEIYPCVVIEDGVVVGHNTHLNWCVSIKEGTKIGKDVYFNTQNHHRNQQSQVFEGLTDVKPIVVEKYCWIGTRSIVLGGLISVHFLRLVLALW